MSLLKLILSVDGYKIGHKDMYPKGTSFIQSNLVARKNESDDMDGVIWFGIDRYIKQLILRWDEFFNLDQEAFDRLMNAYVKEIESYLGDKPKTDHLEQLYKYGKLPLRFKTLPEGTKVPFGTPLVTIENTEPWAYWLVSYIETSLLAEVWPMTTSATKAFAFKKLFSYYLKETDKENIAFADYQGHDFSLRGMEGIEGGTIVGMGHLTSFKGTDTVPSVLEIKTFYDTKGCEDIGVSVYATEHSVMSSGTKENELETYRRLLTDYDDKIISIVSDTWDIWNVLTNILPQLKDLILTREGKLVIRPDSGNPLDIIFGTKRDIDDNSTPEEIGVLRLLEKEFGSEINSQGYKVLNDKVSLIYGDQMNYENIANILETMREYGYATSNIVFGIGATTYQRINRDTYGFAMKATFAIIDGKEVPIDKDPVTGNGFKKSAKGLLAVDKELNLVEFDNMKDYLAFDNQLKEWSWKEPQQSFCEIKERINKYII